MHIVRLLVRLIVNFKLIPVSLIDTTLPSLIDVFFNINWAEIIIIHRLVLPFRLINYRIVVYRCPQSMIIYTNILL